jgi:hypothetical protein
LSFSAKERFAAAIYPAILAPSVIAISSQNEVNPTGRSLFGEFWYIEN